MFPHPLAPSPTERGRGGTNLELPQLMEESTYAAPRPHRERGGTNLELPQLMEESTYAAPRPHRERVVGVKEF